MKAAAVSAEDLRCQVGELTRRVGTLEDEAEIGRRLANLEEWGSPRVRVYRFVESETANFAVRTLCRVAGVSASAYYAWRSRGEGPSEALVDEAVMASRVFDVWQSSRGRYGAPRVAAALHKVGVAVNEKRVARLMAELGVAGKSGRRKLRTTRRDPAATPAADLVERDFTADQPDELWVGDISYIPTDEGWLFVASVLDVHTRMLVGWSIADHMRTELCTDAMACAAATRGRSHFAGTVFHSDHGCQYTSTDFKAFCRDMRIVQSMGTVGDRTAWRLPPQREGALLGCVCLTVNDVGEPDEWRTSCPSSKGGGWQSGPHGGQNMHPAGKPAGLSLPDLPV